MPDINYLLDSLVSNQSIAPLRSLYGDRAGHIAHQRDRYIELVERFQALYPSAGDVQVFSVPGRTEVGGNHTDHNGGRVLAAAVDLDIIAVAMKEEAGTITLHSEGYPPSVVDLQDLSQSDAEKYTSTSLIRGVCARLRALGYQIGGFSAYASSEVMKGSGLSSSAAYEVLVVTILNHLYNQGRIDPVLAAQIGMYAENHYFGKPSGLMDQMTCAVGGFVTIDFKDSVHPVVRKVAFDFASSGYSLVIVDTGGNHADLTDEYAAVAREMRSVAAALGKTVLRECTLDQLIDAIPRLRGEVSDRAILRSLHFFQDDQRVVEQVDALEKGEFDRFLSLVVASGISSWTLNQNVYSSKNVGEQGVSLALAMSELVLKGQGAWRVHGGGFAGTIQAFVPNHLQSSYIQRMRSIFGVASCFELTVRPVGGTRVDLV